MTNLRKSGLVGLAVMTVGLLSSRAEAQQKSTSASMPCRLRLRQWRQA